jgi:multidrug efflux pump subunit AcrA (membrane-fusion protein)
VTLWINEMDISNVQLKQHAAIELPALPDLHLQAVVDEIAVTAQDKNMALSPLALRRSGEAFVNVVKVTLSFDRLPDAVRERIRVGFTANVNLELEPAVPVLSVPWQAVGTAADGSSFVDVVNGSQLETHPVKLGRSNRSCVEIVSGLREGQTVRDRSGARIPLRESKVPEAAPEQDKDGAATDSADDATVVDGAQPQHAKDETR